MLNYQSNRRIYAQMSSIPRESSQPTSPLTFPESILKKSIEDLPKTPCIKKVSFPQDLCMHPTPKKTQVIKSDPQQDYTLILVVFILFIGFITILLLAFN